MYADIHCHPAKVAYDSTFMANEGHNRERSDPWQIPQSNLKSQSQGTRAVEYSQCDLAKSTQARVKLMFAALSPVEKGFFYGISGGRFGKKMITEYFRRFQFDGEKDSMEWLIGHLKTQPGLERTRKTDLDFLKTRLTHLPFERIVHIQNGHYDYFEELKQQYKFYLSKAGEKTITYGKLQLEARGPQQTWEGTYQLAKTGSEVLHRLRPDNDDVVIVLTIDGIHSLGIGNPEEDFFHSGDEHKDVSVEILKSRIRQLKGEEPLEDTVLKNWSHCPFYITLAQHFNNTLCGHAHSLPSLSRFLCDQRKGMDKGISKNSSYEIMRELLGLDGSLRTNGSKRILIDIKHMSASARQDFYKTIIRLFNSNVENRDNKIPIVASNIGYAGVESLEELITNAQQGLEEDDFRINKFKAWNINLCSEDVIDIHQSHGLIGISLDQHTLGHYRRSLTRHLSIPIFEKRNAKTLLARTLEQFVRIPFDYHLEEPHRIWDILCLGTGFDGSMNPINRYSTVLDMGTLEEDLIEIISGIKAENPNLVGDQSAEHLARKICFENAYDFVVEHYK